MSGPQHRQARRAVARHIKAFEATIDQDVRQHVQQASPDLAGHGITGDDYRRALAELLHRYADKIVPDTPPAS